MRFVVLLSILLLLASCSNYSKKPPTVPPKVFQYAYKAPTRALTEPAFSATLSKGKLGDSAKLKLSNHQATTVKLGRSYFSASGYQCRKYTMQSRNQFTACKINGRWYNASPLVLENKTQQKNTLK